VARWTQATYEMVAEKVSQGWRRDAESRITLAWLAQSFAQDFAADNPKFDRQRFLAACGVLRDAHE
jgi:hypothetical protein